MNDPQAPTSRPAGGPVGAADLVRRGGGTFPAAESGAVFLTGNVKGCGRTSLLSWLVRERHAGGAVSRFLSAGLDTSVSAGESPDAETGGREGVFGNPGDLALTAESLVRGFPGRFEIIDRLWDRTSGEWFACFRILRGGTVPLLGPRDPEVLGQGIRALAEEGGGEASRPGWRLRPVHPIGSGLPGAAGLYAPGAAGLDAPGTAGLDAPGPVLVDGPAGRLTQIASVPGSSFIHVLMVTPGTRGTVLTEAIRLAALCRLPLFTGKEISAGGVGCLSEANQAEPACGCPEEPESTPPLRVFEAPGAVTSRTLRDIPKDTDIVVAEDFTRIFLPAGFDAVDPIASGGTSGFPPIFLRRRIPLLGFVVNAKGMDPEETTADFGHALSGYGIPVVSHPFFQ